ncbi:thioredoxin domain-containing protein 6 isoform X2 [Patella vulgata]|uniref:thioredoxin domain-containing protein 6 isoform X2 n=1 Tax=Patella vulgata TaxID=6465 RepID=UPI00217F7117|nr:thioredoxin domain-containing protein 6 isoform X2 [Patella vulgata]
MARKKQEIQLQQEIETQEEWEEMMAKEGLWVVDIYQEWCGPCSAMVSNFRRLKNELGDDLLHFATAKVDTIDALEKYKGRCEPTFLFFACGVLVAVIHGSQSPLVMRTVTEQLAQEHKVMEGASERKETVDTIVSQSEEKVEDDEESEGDEDNIYRYRGEHINFGDTLVLAGELEVKGFTVAIIKPDAVKSGKVEEVLEQMREKGLEIIAEKEKELTEDEAREFYSHLKDEEYFESLVQYMTSGPSHIILITKGTTGDTVLSDWRDMIGPTDVEEAKEQAPDSLRAKYGTGNVMNALHGSSSPETAAREMAFFFPDQAAPTHKKSKASSVQRTLALIRPDAFRTQREEILEKIRESGFKVALQKEMTLTKEQAAEFYKEHEDQPYFEDLITRMSSGPLMALGLARDDAVQGWREMLGPKEVEKAKTEAPESLRAQFSVEDVEINQLHGSDSPETAQKELEYFFPMEQTVACIKPDGIGTKDAIVDKIHEAGFRIAAQKETTITKDIAEEFYAEHKDKEYFNDLVQHMCSGPTMFMVLSREDAVSGWREAIGPTDPEKAKVEVPDCIRAMFGSSVLENAVHGSSNTEHAKKSIEQVFGHLEFNSDEMKPVNEQEEQAERRSPVDQVAETAPENKPDEVENKSDETKDNSKTDSDKPTDDSKTDSDKPTDDSKTDSDNKPTDDSKTDSYKTTDDSKTDSEKPTDNKTDSDKPTDDSKTDSDKPIDDNTIVRDSKQIENKTTTETPEQTEKSIESDQTEDKTQESNSGQEASDQSKPSEETATAEESSANQEEDKKPGSEDQSNDSKPEAKEEESSDKKDETVTEGGDKAEESKEESKTEESTEGAAKTDDNETKPEDASAKTEGAS